MMKHDSRDAAYRFPGGAVPAGSRVMLAVDAPEARETVLRCWYEGAQLIFPMQRTESGRFSCEITLPERPGLFWYFFIADGLYYGNAPDTLGGEGAEYAYEPPSFQITLYDPAFAAPAWTQNGIMMQIFPDRFFAGSTPSRGRLPNGAVLHEDWYEPPFNTISADNGDNAANDFFGGDLDGIRRKLGYIKSLGVNVIYLNPIFMSPSNHRYNTADYLRIDPALGTRGDLTRLCAEARGIGIRIILDGVFSHTGADSVYFNKYGTFDSVGAYQSKLSPYYRWYSFKNWPDKYESWWGFGSLPNVNETEPDYRSFIYDRVIRGWMEAGISGWRLDVADELPMDFIRGLRSAEKDTDADSLLIGEVWEDPTNKTTYGEQRCYACGDTLDGTMNYPLRDSVIAFFTGGIDAYRFAREVMHMYETRPEPFYTMSMNLLGSHDKARVISVLSGSCGTEPEREERRAVRLSDEEYARGRARFIAAWRTVCFLPGMPCLYYGDEAGLTGMADPFNRGTYPWGREDTELLSRIRDITMERRRSPVLNHGGVRVEAVDADTFEIVRTGKRTVKKLRINRNEI